MPEKLRFWYDFEGKFLPVSVIFSVNFTDFSGIDFVMYSDFDL